MSEETLFVLALEITEAERAGFLDRECAGNPDLRARVEALLQAHADSGDFLPAIHVDETAPYSGSPGTSRSEQPGTVIAGKYKLLEEIGKGKGGMGTVWKAEQAAPVKRQVAVKFIRADRFQSRNIVARFEAERQAIALMDHPHIARLFDAGTTADGAPFFVMELIQGVELTDYCDQHRLSVPDRLHLFVQICSAVQHAHQKGIIHRDLKPANILVESHDGKPVPKVIDFGLAKATGGLQLTEHTLSAHLDAIVGTPLYMAPEQATFNAVDVDTRADIYSLGVILYELLTGSTPIERERLKKEAMEFVLRVIREEEPPTPSKRLSTTDSAPSVAANRHTEPAKLTRLVHGDLDWIVMRALEKDRNRRYATANGFAEDIECFLNHEPVSVGPPTVRYRLRKFVKRNKGPVVAGGLVLLTLLVGIAGTTFGLVRADSRRLDAERAREDEAEQRALAESHQRDAEQAREDEAAAKHDADEKRRLAEKAAAAAKAANEQTQRRLAQIEKGVELFAGMLSGVDPRAEEKWGDPLYVQLRQRAEKAADALDAEAVGDRLAVARLQTILGTTLRDLGGAAKAVEVLEKARAIRERDLGTDDLDTLTTLHNLASAYQAVGRLPEAIALFEHVRDATVKTLGADHPDTLATLNNLALAYRAAGRLPEAIALFERVRDAQVKTLGADHRHTLTTLDNLALAYQNARKLPEAIALFERVRQARVKTLGADHFDTLTTLNNLALAYVTAGRLPEAIALFKHVRDATVKKLGADHPDTLRTLNNLASAYLHAEKLPEAIALFKQVRDATVKTLGADHPHTLTTLNNLALAYLHAGKLPEAIALFERVRQARVKTLGADHPGTLTTLGNLAAAYQATGSLPEAIVLFEQAATGIAKRRFQHEHAGWIVGDTIAAYEQAGQLDKAEGWRRQWLAVIKEEAGADSSAYAGELAALGLNLLQQKKWADAESILRECLAIREKKEPVTWNTFNAQSMLGDALLGQQKYAEAEPLLLKSYEGMRQCEDMIPPPGKPRLGETLDRLIELYTAWGKPDEAKKSRLLQTQLNELEQAQKLVIAGKFAEAIEKFERIHKDRAEKIGKDHPDTMAALHGLGRAWLARGETDRAIACFEEVRYASTRPFPPREEQLRAVSVDLANAYRAAGKVKEAIALIEQLFETLKRQLGTDHPMTLVAQAELATAIQDAGRFHDAGTLLTDAAQRMTAKFGPDHPATLQTQIRLAVLYIATKKYADAEPLLLKGYEGMKAREKTIPPHDRYRIPEALDRLIELYTVTDKPDEAQKWRTESLDWFDKVISTLEPVHRAAPEDSQTRQFLRNSHYGRALAHHALKKYSEAAKDWDRAIELSPPSEQNRFRASRTYTLVLAGRVAEALAEVAELTKSSNWPAPGWYDFVCVYAVATGKIADKKQEYADRAMELLRQAIRAGYKDAAQIKKDVALDPLRDRADFKKLLTELEAKPERAPPPKEKK